MDEDESLRRYGLHPTGADLEDVRCLLSAHTRLERRAQGDGDTELMKLCCVQLFNAGNPEDVLLIWRAKAASMDAGCSIDIQLLCGGGLDETKAHLSKQHLSEAAAALEQLNRCETDGDFKYFSVDAQSAQYAAYYR
ncbi:hypothetical protein [Streptomyces canus]|uniref:hypothetical protein n=1 Tax=Streptomyces canus TaxID=58343 RepID=UPI00035EE6F5|nr:hypothetical protein [Streptomyces canus]